MSPWFFFGTALAPQAAGPAPDLRWQTRPFELFVEGYGQEIASGHLLLMTRTADRPSAMFECTEDQIFASFAPPGVDPRAELADQWMPGPHTRWRRVRWSTDGENWTRPREWSWVRGDHYRPVEFDTKMAMWESAQAGGQFSIRVNNQDMTVVWPAPDAEIQAFIEACGWAED